MVESDLRKRPPAVRFNSSLDTKLPSSPVFGPPDSLEPGPGPAIERIDATLPPVHAPSKMSEAPRSPLAQHFNEFHGLIVQIGKHHCLKKRTSLR